MRNAPAHPAARTHWEHATIRDLALGGFQTRAAEADLEQAVLGLDALPELALHTLLHDAYRGADLGVHTEVRYPRTAGKRKRSEGERCDIVLCADPDAPIMDTAQAGTLFAGAGVPPDQTYWLEVKVLRQHAIINGVARPNQAYASNLGGPIVADIRKLASDDAIVHAGVLLALFTIDTATGAHDVSMWAHKCLDKGLPIDLPLIEQFPLTNRLGNGACTVALLPLRSR